MDQASWQLNWRDNDTGFFKELIGGTNETPPAISTKVGNGEQLVLDGARDAKALLDQLA